MNLTNISSIQMLYEFVFTSRDDNQPFSIFQSYPRTYISYSTQETIGEAGIQGLLAVEADGMVDPMTFHGDIVEVQYVSIITSHFIFV